MPGRGLTGTDGIDTLPIDAETMRFAIAFNIVPPYIHYVDKGDLGDDKEGADRGAGA